VSRANIAHHLAIILLLAIATPPLYVLSIFPVMQLGYEDKLSWKAIDTIYAPVFWVGDRCPLVNQWLTAGDYWWRGRGPSPPDPQPTGFAN
jgi:hypothetical protein